MIKAKVVSFTLSKSVDSISRLDLETYLEDPVVPELFCGADFCDGLDVVVMTNEEYEAMDSVRTVLYKSLLEEMEKTRKLEEENEAIQKDIKDLEEKLAQEAAEVDLCPDGAIVFKKKMVSELEKKVKKLEEENKYLKRRLLIRYTVNVDADGAIIYPELKED